MTYLLDVNFLIALVDQSNLHHNPAHRWLSTHRARLRWATCAITENGLCRVLSSPAYPGALSPGDAAAVLSELRQGLRGHEFWPCDISMAQPELMNWRHVQGSKQLTDLYLLALAVHHGACLVTFDRNIRWTAVQGADASHLVIP